MCLQAETKNALEEEEFILKKLVIKEEQYAATIAKLVAAEARLVRADEERTATAQRHITALAAAAHGHSVELQKHEVNSSTCSTA